MKPTKGDGIQNLPPEDDEGNIEYKLKLVNPSPLRLQHLVTQLKWRLREGSGEAIYEIGVEDDGQVVGLSDDDMDASITTLRKMADRYEMKPTKGDGIQNLPPEDDEGNIEYKLKLVNPSPLRLQHLVTQLKWRLREGSGEAIYEIGVEDDGQVVGLSDDDMDASITTLRKMADRLDATVSILRDRTVDDISLRRVSEVLVRKIPESQEFIDLRVAVLGSADAGKSTLLGVVTQGEMDNGRGRARLNLFRHLHEIQSGRTSSVSLDVVGFDSAGEMVSHKYNTMEEILEKSSKLITFIDLAGHQKYLKTTIFGLTGYKPHFVMLVVAANIGIVSTTREHLGLSLALEVPVYIVVTKVDLVSAVALKRIVTQLENLVKGPGCARIPVRVNTGDDIIPVAASFAAGRVVPVFVVSSVTGENLDLVGEFLNVVPSTPCVNERQNIMQENIEFRIDEVFHVSSGPIAAGFLVKGIIRETDSVVVGPFNNGEFIRASVSSIHRNKAPTRLVQCGQAASIALAQLPSHAVAGLRKGMAVLDARMTEPPAAVTAFEADVYVLYHPVDRGLCRGFQMTVHIGNVCQTAFVEQMDRPCLKTSCSARVVLRFIKQPEFIVIGSRLLFREGKTKGIGQVTRIIE